MGITISKHRFLPKLLFVVFTATSVLSVGCQEDEIRRYEVPRVEAPGAPLTYKAPADWKKHNASGPIRAEAAFLISAGDKAADVTITRLPGAAGGVLANVNRWRGQIHLEQVDEQQLHRELRPIDVAGTAAQYVDLIGPESAGPPPQRILGVILPRGEQTWFFTIKGPADLVEKQKAAFETFVKSVRFEGGKGS